MNIGMDTKITDMIKDNKKPFIHKGRKVFSWYHPDFRSQDTSGGPEGTRTPDLLHAIETLSQLRYRPIEMS
jgi:hypothetical protein